MSSRSRLLSACAATFALGACDRLSLPRACTADFRYGLNVTVADSLTGAPPPSATLIARAGAYVDSVGPQAPFLNGPQGPSVLLLSAAGERPGTYDLTVRAPGYRDWTRTGVQVTADECHVHPVSFTARLQK
ncbi:MAG: carboxypeptidase-like regulatory domain-containing protein [Longimicrobiaceae bacterium]